MRRCMLAGCALIAALWCGCNLEDPIADRGRFDADRADGAATPGGDVDGEGTAQDGASSAEDAVDGTGDDPGGGDVGCEVRVDGGCRCFYKDREAGVCTNATIDPSSGACEIPAGYESEETSCDGLDNDCDGEVDEAEKCTCTYDPDSPEGIGDDSEGTGVCADQRLTPEGTCPEPEHFEPATDAEESCDDLDNDCDGVADEGCSCTYGETGVCTEGTISPEDGECAPPSSHDPTDDEGAAGNCDDLDNDCDGVVDEGCSCEFGNSEQGVCTEATISADDGECTPPTSYDSTDDEAGAGNCDDLDNDCDGTVDEGCECVYNPESNDETGETDGPYANGVCLDQSTQPDGTCAQPGQFEPTETQCDGSDNDCDGTVDEGCECVYDPDDEDFADEGDDNDHGVCRGQQRDAQGKCQEPRDFEPPTDEEASCDGNDNDCDGVADEGCTCDYEGKSTGVCSEASIATDGSGCEAPDSYVAREEDPPSTYDVCDDLDNDCDGVADERCPCVYDPTASDNDDDNDGDASHEAGVCQNRTIDKTGVCRRPNEYFEIETSQCPSGTTPSTDNDCDGDVDEDEPLVQAGERCERNCECRTGLCRDNVCAHVVFATAEEFDGANDLEDGLPRADELCNKAAKEVDLRGTWAAIISTKMVDASSRISIRGPVHRNADYARLAESKSDFWDGDIDNPVRYDQWGNSISRYVWTGTSRNGSASQDTCNDWNNGSRGTVGQTDYADRRWIDADAMTCGKHLSLYCINGQ